MKASIIVILLLLFPVHIQAQHAIGVPGITNYPPRQYGADPSVRQVHQDASGLLYFANDDGLLTFDGSYWKQYSLPNKTAVRALAIDPKGRIYTGGQDELGYFYPGDNGALRFHSLAHLIPPVARQFADIWDVVMIRDEVFFRTNESILRLHDSTITTFDAPHQWQLLCNAGGRLYAADREEGLFLFRNNQWLPLGKTKAGLHFTAITPFRHDTLLAATAQNGLFLLHDTTLQPFTSAVSGALAAAQLDEDHFAIGTANEGCMIIDAQGRLLQQFSRDEGLQGNAVQTIYPDHDRHLWLGLKNGIAMVSYRSAIKHIYPDAAHQLSTYSAHVYNQQLYIGTADGLYSLPLQGLRDLGATKAAFSMVPGTGGKAWDLSEIHHQLFLGHMDGVFLVNGNTATPLLKRAGCWMVTGLPGSNAMIAGTYTGLHLLQGTRDAGSIDGLYESLHYLATEGNVVWASHPYRGVFRMVLSADKQNITQLQHFTQADGLPSTQNNFVYTLNGRMVVATEDGIYQYTGKRFVPDTQYSKTFHNIPLRYLVQDSSHNTWFISRQQVGVAAPGQPIVYFPEMNGQLPNENACIYPYDRNNVFVGSNTGMFHLDYAAYLSAQRPPTAMISAVKVHDSLAFGGYAVHDTAAALEDLRHGPGFPNRWNNVHVEYSSPQYDQAMQYSYQLQGFDTEWSAWTGRTEKDYTNLPYGEYVFRVRARNNLGAVSAPASFAFVIRPAWYETITAFIIYGCLLTALVYYLLKWQENRLTRAQQKRQVEQEKQLYLQQLELDRNEKEIISLQKNQLAAQVDFKNKELATVTMLLVERRTLLSKIRGELNRLLKTVPPAVASDFKALLRMLEHAEEGEDDWQQFAIHFDEVHSNFLSTLKKKYPVLSPTDLKLCAYLRINLSSKEIAQLLNISAKSVEVSRYRLRKKLELPTEVNLFDFLLRVTA